MNAQILCCLFFILLCCPSLSAQVHLGFGGGGGLDNQVSVRASLPFEVEISKILSLQSAFTYTQQHTPALLFRLGHQRDYRRATLGYVGMPVFAKFQFTIAPFRFYALAGPQLDYATSFSATYLEDGFLRNQKLEFNSLQIARWNVSAIGGIGIEKSIHNNYKIRLELLYLLGLADLDRRHAAAIYTEGKVFQLGFLIPL